MLNAKQKVRLLLTGLAIASLSAVHANEKRMEHADRSVAIDVDGRELPGPALARADETLAILSSFPGFAHYLEGEYDDATINRAIDVFASQLPAKTASPTLRQLAERYRPIFRFSKTFPGYCAPIAWSEANRNMCSERMPERVPVYLSYSFRRAENGGGTHSVWINYHVFYGYQRGYAGIGAHGDDWEVTSLLLVNGTPSAVRYRVHGSAVNTMPFASANRTGDQLWVYPGYYFHGGYPNSGCPATAFLTWNDCRGETYVLDSQVLDCEFNAPGGDSCTNFPASRNLWTEDTYASKDTSQPTRFNWQVPSSVRPTANQLCYATDASWNGIVDCIDVGSGNTPNLGKTFNDRISSYWLSGPLPPGVRGFSLHEHADFGGRTLDAQVGTLWRNLPSDFNDRTTSLRVNVAN